MTEADFSTNKPEILSAFKREPKASILRNYKKLYDAKQCNPKQCNAKQCNSEQCDAMRCDAMECNAFNAMQYYAKSQDKY